jgi:hypothetical protein
VAVATTDENTGSVDLLGSPGNPAEDGFTAVSRKKRVTLRAVKSDDSTKSVQKQQSLVYGVHNTVCTLPVVSKRVKTEAFFAFTFLI